MPDAIVVGAGPNGLVAANLLADRGWDGLDLEAHGLAWCHGDFAVAHPASDGTCVVLSPRLEETMASVDAFAPGDGEAWRRLYATWERVGPHIADALVTPFPPVRPALRIAA